MIRTTVLLLACFILAQADKQVMGLLAVQVQASFALSDTQLGFLQGGAFAIAFAIGGLPVARLIDRGHRIRLAAACVALWSLATIACGLAGSFGVLLLFRAATAVAEAGLPPAAFSIFAQHPDRRLIARMTGTFMLAPFIGGGLMLLLGAWLLAATQGGAFGLESWRLVLVAVGVPGLVLAPVLAWLGHEPARAAARPDSPAPPDFRGVFAQVFRHRPFLRDYYLGMTALYVAVAAVMAWYPALLVREMGLTISGAGARAGVTYLACGVAGTLAATAYVSSRRDLTAAAIVRMFRLAAALLTPAMIALPLMGSQAGSLVLYGVFAFLSAAILAIMPVPIQLSLDSRLLARGSAIMSLLMSALAGTIGPIMVGVLADRTGLGLRGALAATALAALVPAVLLFENASRNNDSMTNR